MKIQQVEVKIINDSRGDKTLEVNLNLDGQEASASVPSGKSKGSSEAFVLDPEKAVKKLEELKPKIEKDFASLEQFDQFLIQLDGTPDKQNLGGNLILVLSIAFTKAWAKLKNLEIFQLIAQISKQEIKLPLCFFNLIEGGVHAQNSLPFQEYLLIPQTNSPKQSLEIVNKAIKLLGEKIQEVYGKREQGDEGGFTIPSGDPMVGLKILQEVFLRSLLEYSRRDLVKFGLDIAASTMQHKPSLEVIKNIVESFPVLSVEDPFDQEDWESFSKLTALIGDKVWIIGDDLLTTNVERIKKAHELQAVNAVLIKPNQIGTITETLQAVQLARSYGWKIIVSHRSGETFDTFIADLSVGVGADGLKSGCPLQKERLVKYERLEEIEKCLT